jgi:hypothetical protein
MDGIIEEQQDLRSGLLVRADAERGAKLPAYRQVMS